MGNIEKVPYTGTKHVSGGRARRADGKPEHREVVLGHIVDGLQRVPMLAGGGPEAAAGTKG